MITSLISVGVFWSILLYHLNKNRQVPRIAQMKMFVGQKTDILKSYLSKSRNKGLKKRKDKNKQEIEAVNSKHKKVQNYPSNQKQYKQKIRLSQVCQDMRKTKLIFKKKKQKKVSLSQHRASISRKNSFNNKLLLEKKDTKLQKEQKNPPESQLKQNPRKDESLLLKDLSFLEDEQISRIQNQNNIVTSQNTIIKYNPFIFDNFQN